MTCYGREKTLREVFDSLTEEQKEVIFYIIGNFMVADSTRRCCCRGGVR